MRTVRKIVSLVLAVWMLAISNGILLIQHYLHGELYTVSLFVSDESSCTAQAEADSESCCSEACSCHHENYIHAVPEWMKSTSLFTESPTTCCFENHAWLHLENSFKKDSESQLLAAFELSDFPVFHFILENNTAGTGSNFDPPPLIPKVSKSILLSTFLC